MKNTAAFWKIVLALFIVYIVWGSTYLAIRVAVLGVPPFIFCSIRYLIAGGFMLGLGFLLKEPLPNKFELRSAILSGLLLLVGGNGSIVWAEQRIPSNLGALVVATMPIWLLLFEGMRPDGERPSRRGLFGVGIGMVGMAILMGPSLIGKQLDAPIVFPLMALLGSMLWSFGQTYTRHTGMPRSQILSNGIAMFASGVAFGGLSLLMREPLHKIWAQPAPSALWAILYLIVFGSCIAYTAFTWLVQNASPSQVSTYAYVNPVVAVFLGAWLLHEPVNGTMLIGAALILASVGLVNQSNQPSPEKGEPVLRPAGCKTSG